MQVMFIKKQNNHFDTLLFKQSLFFSLQLLFKVHLLTLSCHTNALASNFELPCLALLLFVTNGIKIKIAGNIIYKFIKSEKETCY